MTHKDPGMDDRVIYAVESGVWSSGKAVLFDGGEFPASRISDVAALVESVIVVADRGAADALRRAGVRDVSLSPGRSLSDALQLTSDAHAPVVLSGVPDKPGKSVASALCSITDPGGTQLPVAAVMFMRAEAPGDGPLCPIAEQSFVSGYGALFAIMLAVKTGRSIRVVAPRADRLKASHSQVVATAMDLARRSGTRFDVVTDPAPRAWAIEHSDGLGAIFCGILQARGQGGTGSGKIARRAGAEAETAVRLLKEASCDVVMVLDRVSVVYGTSVGAQVAKVIGGAMVATVAVGGVAAPAAAATAPPTAASSVVVGRTASGRGSGGDYAAQAGADQQAPAADQTSSTQATAGQAADQTDTTDQTTPAQTTPAQTTDQTTPAQTTDQTSSSSSTEQAADQTDTTDLVDEGDSGATQDAVDVGTDNEASGDQSTVVEDPVEYISFRVWTDSHGVNHVISSGLQDHWVDTPALPDWAVADGGDHPWLAKPNPDYVSPESVAQQSSVQSAATGSQAGRSQTNTAHKKAHRQGKKHTGKKRNGKKINVAKRIKSGKKAKGGDRDRSGRASHGNHGHRR